MTYWPTSPRGANCPLRSSKFLKSKVLLTALLLTGGAWAQERGFLAGRVLDARTGEPLPGAAVTLSGTVLGTMTDLEGRFVLEVPPGTYAVEALLVGYGPARREVEISPGDTTKVVLKLEERPLKLPPVVVTATKKAQPLREVPISTSVVGKDELRARPAQTLDQVLRYVPGVELKGGEVGIRASTGYSQGAGSRVLLLVDGAPAITGDTGGINWDAIPAGEIERIEVVKGAGSALYGSNAMAGVIQVFTRRPSRIPRTWLRMAAGCYDRPYHPEWRWSSKLRTFYSFELSHSRRLGPLGVLISGSRQRSDGYRQNGDYLRHRLMGKLEAEPFPGSRADLTLHWAEEDRGQFLYWKSQEHALEVPEGMLGDRVYSGKFRFNGSFRLAFGPELAALFRGYAYRTHWHNSFHDSHDRSRALRAGCEARAEASLGELSFTLGGEVARDGVSSSMFGDHRLWDVAGYVQTEWRPSPLTTLTLGLRYDRQVVDGGDKVESQVSPKFGATFRLSPEMVLRASMGRGFRAPSVAERFTEAHIAGFRVVPNPELRPERSWGYEVGLRWTSGTAMADLALFQTEYWDLVEPQVISAVLGWVKMANLTRARVKGIELELRAGLSSGFSGSLGYTYIVPREGRLTCPCEFEFLQALRALKDSDELPYRPRHRLLTSLRWRGGPFNLEARFRYASRVRRVKMYPQDERVPQYVVDLSGGVRLRNCTFSFRVDNLLQYHYTEVERNLAPIRSFTVTLTAEL